MMLKRTCIGLDIGHDVLHAVAVQRRGKQLILCGANSHSLEAGTVTPGFSDSNVLKPDLFVRSVKELLEPLMRRDNRISISLPDRSGNVFLLDVETPFKNYAEGSEIVRWQLKDLLPDKTSPLIVDYQILEEKDSGLKKLLVAVASRDVLKHYEALIEQAGFAAAMIDFHSLALYNAYRSRVDLGRDFILIGVDGCQLSIQVFVNQVPVFHRTRQVEHDPQQIFQEVNRSLVGCRKDLSNFNRIPVFLHNDWAEGELLSAVDAVFDQTVESVTSPMGRLIQSPQFNADSVDVNSMVAALGAVEQLTPGVTS